MKKHPGGRFFSLGKEEVLGSGGFTVYEQYGYSRFLCFFHRVLIAIILLSSCLACYK